MMKHIQLFEEFLTEGRLEATMLNTLAGNQVGTGRAEDFLAKHKLDLEALTKAKMQGVIDQYEIRDVVNGKAHPSKEKEFFKNYILNEDLNEAALNRDAMMKWLKKYLKFVDTTERFGSGDGGIWVSGEDDTNSFPAAKGKRLYDYYAQDKNYELGVLNAWEKELNKRGWYSEWYDAGTVMIWPE